MEDENKKIVNTQNLIMEKLNGQSKKLYLLVKLITDLNSHIEGDIEEVNNVAKDDKMILD